MERSVEGAATFSAEDILEVAKWQKYIIWMVLISFIGAFIKGASLPIGVIMIYFIYKVAVSVRSSAPWAYVIAAFIPFISFIALLYVNSIATKTLQSHGIRVGLMGANASDLEKLKEEHDNAENADDIRGDEPDAEEYEEEEEPGEVVEMIEVEEPYEDAEDYEDEDIL